VGDSEVAHKHFIAAVAVVAIIFILPFLAAGQPETEPAGREQLLDRIERNIELRRIEIADYYDRRMDTLRRRAERQLVLFERAQAAKLYEYALDWYDYGYLPIGYMMVEYGRMISLEQIAHARHRIQARSEQIARRLERSIASLQQQKDYTLNVSMANEKARLIEAFD
jgi:hypothetical protein